MRQLVSVISYLEAFSALMLFSVAMPVKYIGGNPELVSIVGAIHGGLFVLFVGLLLSGVGKHWNRVAFYHGFVAAVIPAGPFLFDGMLISGEYDIK